MRYAALRTLIVIILGIILAQSITIPNLFLIIGVIVALGVGYLTKWHSLYFALLLVSSLNYNRSKAKQNIIENFPLYEKNVKIQAQIIDSPISESNRYSAKLLQINNHSVSGKVFLYIKDINRKETNLVNPVKINLSYGDIVELNAIITDFDFPKNPNLIDYNAYFHKQDFIGNVFTFASEIKTVKAKHGCYLIRYIIIPVRNYIFKTIDQFLDGDEKDLLLGMLLGEKRGMSSKLRATFTDTGVAHILAVSGLHIGILIGVVLLLLPIIRIHGLSALIIIFIVTILYLSVIGFKASAVRAGLMVIFASVGLLWERKYEPTNGIFVAALIILLISPQALFDISFQLSFSAALLIILITPRLYNLIKQKQIPKFIKHFVLFPLFISFSASIGTAPIILYYFFQYPLLVMGANIIIIPLVTLALPLGFLVILFNLFLPALASIYANTLWLILKSIIFMSDKFAHLKWQIIEPGRPSILLITLFYLLVLLILFWKNLRFRKIALVVLLFGLNFFIWQKVLQPKQLTVTFLDIKQGDAIFLETPNGRKMLIDAGIENEIVSQFFKSKGIKNIDLAVITHPHLDHYGGYRNLIDNIKIKTFIIATDISKDTIYTNLINIIKNRQIKHIFAEQGQTIKGLGVKVEVLSPDVLTKQIYNMNALEPNDISIVLKMKYENTTLLLPGDLDNTQLIAKQPIHAQILKSPHHASKKANNNLLFSKVKPEYLIVTGRKNINQDVLDLIEQYRIKVFNIRKDGAITIKANQSTLKFIKYKK